MRQRRKAETGSRLDETPPQGTRCGLNTEGLEDSSTGGLPSGRGLTVA